MPVYVYSCPECGTRVEVFIRRIVGEPPGRCGHCGATGLERVISPFAVMRNLASQLANLDPMYRRRIDDAIARTPEADPMRLLSKMTPFETASDPGDPIDF